MQPYKTYNSNYPIGKRLKRHTPNLIGTNREPWITRKSIEFLYDFATKNKLKSVLEYGSGSSTAWFLEVLNCDVTSVEHEEGWLNEIDKILPQELKNHWIKIHKPTTPEGDLLGSDKKYYDEYVNCSDQLENFDIIMIDGRCRSHCILKTIDKLNKGGLFIIDDSDRENYQQAISNIPKNWIRHDFKNSVSITSIWENPA